MRWLLLLASGLCVAACNTSKCNNTGECAAGDVCVLGQNVCRKRCTQPIDCGGAQTCAHLPDGQYACLEPNEIVRLPPTQSTDTTLGNPCYSPAGDGHSEETESLPVCGDTAPLCTPVFGPNEPALADFTTCTTECSVDSDCPALASSACTGDCKAAYDHLCCIPPLPVASSEQHFGARKSGTNGQVLTLFCRPRVACYLVPKRCGKDADCGAPGSRAGSTCSTTSDGGGACLSGHLGMYECCNRKGECDQDLLHGSAGQLICQESLDRKSGYCTKPCSIDDDCRPPAVPNASMNASCWTTRFVESDSVAGKCTVEVNPRPICRNQPKPTIPSPATALVTCDFSDRPLDKPDNKYDAATRGCVR